MKTLSVVVLLALAAGATACAATPAPTTAHHARPVTPSDDGLGATNAQGSGDAARLLSKAECEELGEYIASVCHETHSRQATIEGWCSDVTSRTTSGNFADECLAKKLSAMDATCFKSTDNAPAMMVCDRGAGQ